MEKLGYPGMVTFSLAYVTGTMVVDVRFIIHFTGNHS